MATQIDEAGRPSRSEDQFTKTIEEYTAAVPSSVYLGVAIGAMALSADTTNHGSRKMGQFYCPMRADLAHHRSVQQAGET